MLDIGLIKEGIIKMESSDKDWFDGIVIFFNSRLGYGFVSWEIEGEIQPDLFIHFSDIACDGFKTLYKNQKVRFQIGLNNRSQNKAVNVQVFVPRQE